MSRDIILVSKLKECIQEAVVFLRTLGDFRIPAVVERRRKELLTKLEGAQGDTRREKPPKFEESPEKEVATPPVVKRVKNEEKQKAKEPTKESDKEHEGSPGPDSGVTSPSRRDSKVVNSLVSGFENLHATAKKAEEEETPKKWQVPLRKTKKPADFPDEEGKPTLEDNTTETIEDSKTEVVEDSKTETIEDSNELKPEASGKRGSTHSLDSTGSTEPDVATPKSKKKSSKFGLLKSKKKRGGRDKSPAPPRKEIPATEEPHDTSAVEVEEAEPAVPEVVVMEEGVKISGKLEYKVKTRLSSKFVSKEVKLKESTLYIGDKDTVMMLGCTVQGNDAGFEVFSHSTQKAHIFKVSEGGDEAKGNWVVAIQTAIDEVTPPKEEDPTESTSADTVPAIQVIEPEPTPEKPSEASKKQHRESKALEVKKPIKSLPTQEVIKGYVHRLKTGGIRSRWEKTYCVVTHSALYFTEDEAHSEYEQMFQVVAGEAIFTEKEKGHDKNSKSVVIKMGKKSEQISIDKKDFSTWWSVLQQAYCFGESLEFNEEDDISEEELIEEDLYEDVASVPPVPSSPRPSRPFVSEVSPEDDIIIDEDIYEDTDDFLPQAASEYQLPVVTMAPKLPGGHPANLPGLPPRNTPPAQPSLPPRNPGPPLPSRGSLPSKPPAPKLPVPKLPAALPPTPKGPAPIPTTNSDDEDLYDDVVAQNADDDDNYDDVVIGGDDDTYDDVVVNEEPITEDFYEDMTPGQESLQEDYVVMEHGEGEVDDDDGELYVDVEAPPTITTPTPKSASPKTKPANSTFSRMFGGRKGSHVLIVHSGQLSYRAPKKTKFEEKFATIEETNMLVYKTSSDKKHQEKIPLGECALELGSKEAGAGEHALRITKGGKVHHFSFKSQQDESGWVEVLKKFVKYAPVSAGEQQVYQATEDHIAETTDEITFKKGSYIRLISKDNEAVWFGQLGNEALVFDGNTGRFPAEKVMLAEDMYI